MEGTNVRIYTKYQDDSPLAYTWQDVTLPNMEFEKFIKLSTDMVARKEWDKNVIHAEIVSKIDDDAGIVYFQVKMPLIFSNREFLLKRFKLHSEEQADLIKKLGLPKKDKKYMLYSLAPIELEEKPVPKGFIRADLT